MFLMLTVKQVRVKKVVTLKSTVQGKGLGRGGGAFALAPSMSGNPQC